MIYLVLGAIIAWGLWYSEKQKAELKEEAERFRKAGKKVYRDKYGVKRSTETMEEVKTRYGSSFDNYHSVVVGKQTGRVYEDLTERKVQKVNERLKAEGKKYILKGGTYLTNLNPTYFQYDSERGKYLRCFSDNRGKRSFLVTFGDYVNGQFVIDENTPRIYTEDVEEGMKWYYNGNSRQTL